jgi:hypothetical protein
MFLDIDQSCCSPYVVGGRDVDGGVGVRNGGKFSFYWLVVRPSLLVFAPFINMIGESTLACAFVALHGFECVSMRGRCSRVRFAIHVQYCIYIIYK